VNRDWTNNVTNKHRGSKIGGLLLVVINVYQPMSHSPYSFYKTLNEKPKYNFVREAMRLTGTAVKSTLNEKHKPGSPLHIHRQIVYIIIQKRGNKQPRLSNKTVNGTCGWKELRTWLGYSLKSKISCHALKSCQDGDTITAPGELLGYSSIEQWLAQLSRIKQ